MNKYQDWFLDSLKDYSKMFRTVFDICAIADMAILQPARHMKPTKQFLCPLSGTVDIDL
jgi:hypothetical protein